MTGNTILTEIAGPQATVWLNRPDKHNAINDEMITEFLTAMKTLNERPEIRLICIRGKGQSFCAGADFDWMHRSSKLSGSDNIKQCESLALCYYTLFKSPKITACIIHGACLGGANGFIAAADLCIAADDSILGFPEVQTGLLPATIAPYIIRKTGKTHALELMLSGRKINARDAQNYGLVANLYPAALCNDFAAEWMEEILKGAPVAQQEIKKYIEFIADKPFDDELVRFTSSVLAQSRVSEEAREGINAFLEKRKPDWHNFSNNS